MISPRGRRSAAFALSLAPAYRRFRRTPDDAADDIIAERLWRANTTPQAIADDLAEGDRSRQFGPNNHARLPEMIADTSDDMQRLTGSVYRQGGEGAGIVKRQIDGRQKGPANPYDPKPGEFAGQSADVEDAVRRSMQISTSAPARKMIAKIEQEMNTEGNKLYAIARSEGHLPANQFDLDSAVQPAGLRMLQYSGAVRQAMASAIDLFAEPLRGMYKFPANTIERFDAAKRQLDEMIKKYRAQPDGGLVVRELGQFRRDLMNAVHAYDDKGLPTKNVAYEKARQAYGSKAKDEEALQLGRARQDSEVTADMFQAMTPRHF